MTKKRATGLRKTNILLLLLVIIITALPFFFHPEGAEFGGADNQGSELVQNEHPGYQVWFEPVWEPPSGEIESLLFAVQAGIGAGIIGYVIGYLKGKKHLAEEQDEQETSRKEILL